MGSPITSLLALLGHPRTDKTDSSLALMEERFCGFCFVFNSELNKDLADRRWGCCLGSLLCQSPERCSSDLRRNGLCGSCKWGEGVL